MRHTSVLDDGKCVCVWLNEIFFIILFALIKDQIRVYRL